MSLLVNHESHLLTVLLTLLDEIERDVTFEVEGVIFKLHRIILVKQSPVFAKMLTSTAFRESHASQHSPISLPDKRADIFQRLVDYFYSGRIELAQMNLVDLANLIEMAHEYDIQKLLEAVADHVQKITDQTNALEIFDGIGCLFNITPVSNQCLKCIDANAENMLNSEDFLLLSLEAVCQILQRDSFAALETEIIFAVDRWLKYNKKSANDVDSRRLFSTVRFGLIDIRSMKIEQIATLFSIASSWGVDLTRQPAQAPRLLDPTENMASIIQHASVTIQPPCEYSMDLYAAHMMDDNSKGCIIVELARACLIDSLKMKLPTYYTGGWKSAPNDCGKCRLCAFEECRCAPRYCFSISSSMDGENWQTLASCTDDYLGGTLLVAFKKRSVKYLKIEGKCEQRGKPEFRIESLECPAFNPRLHLGEGEETSIIELKYAKRL